MCARKFGGWHERAGRQAMALASTVIAEGTLAKGAGPSKAIRYTGLMIDITSANHGLGWLKQ